MNELGILFHLIFWPLIIWRFWIWLGKPPVEGASNPFGEDDSESNNSSPTEVITQEVKDNWLVVFENDGYIAYWDGVKEGGEEVKIYCKPDLFLEEELGDFDGSSASKVKERVAEWHDDLFGYPYKFEVTDDIYAVWNGMPWLDFFSIMEDKFLYRYQAPDADEPCSRSDAEELAWYLVFEQNLFGEND